MCWLKEVFKGYSRPWKQSHNYAHFMAFLELLILSHDTHQEMNSADLLLISVFFFTHTHGTLGAVMSLSRWWKFKWRDDDNVSVLDHSGYHSGCPTWSEHDDYIQRKDAESGPKVHDLKCKINWKLDAKNTWFQCLAEALEMESDDILTAKNT